MGLMELMIGLLALLVLAALVFGVIFKGMGFGSSSSTDALGILEERFARGEIEEEEFARRRDLIRQGRN